MANHKEIGEIVKKCKVLLLDIEGTTTSISFVKDKLFPYAEENVKSFLESKWETEDVKEVVAALRKQSLEDQEKSVEGAVKIPGEDATKEEQIEGLVGSVKWQMAADRKAGPLKQLQGLIWKQGYESGDIKGHVYDDVSPALELWRSTEGRKVYIYSSGSVQAQKLLFGQSVAGDMLKYIDGHFDTAVGAKQEEASYTKIVEEIGCKNNEILFLTDIVKEAEAAVAAGVEAALVSREGNAALPAEATAAFPVLHSFDQLANPNKRKPEDQDVQPAKIPKTDNTDDVTSSVDETSAKEATVEEKMEVEAEAVPKEDVAEPMEEVKEVVTEIKVTEITDTNGDAETVVATPVVAEPIVTEAVESTESKTEEKQMDTDDTDAKPEKVEEPKVESSKTEEPAEAVEITEIEDGSDKQALDDVADIIDKLEPVVEEPATEMEDLQTVGEVLEKECDEILSKVQDVTNLDNIAVKPLLTPISEEMEAENVDSNDIVDRILDTELEMEMRSDELPKEDAKEVVPETEKAEVTNVEESQVTAETAAATEVPVEPTPEPEKSETNGDSEPQPEVTEKTEPTAEESKVEPPKDQAMCIPEVQVNGKAINGNGDAPVNGDSKDELTSRLTENGKEVNGTNGEAVEEGQGDAKVEEVEIKVKSVAEVTDRTDPVEQPTEA